MAFDFTGKTAIVTGGTQGIGLEIAKGIVAGGGHVALIARNAAKGEAAVAELGEGNKFYQLDVADAPKARETVEQIFTDLPQTNILINCAGVISTKKFDEIDDTEWRRTIDINLNGTFTMMNAVYPHFKAAHAGTIVNVSSVAGKIGGGLLGLRKLQGRRQRPNQGSRQGRRQVRHPLQRRVPVAYPYRHDLDSL